MQPLALTEMANSHVLVLTALDQEMKVPQCSLTLGDRRSRPDVLLVWSPVTVRFRGMLTLSEMMNFSKL